MGGDGVVTPGQEVGGPARAISEQGLFRIQGGAGLPDEDIDPGLDAASLRDLFSDLVLMRAFDERAVSLQRQGRIGTYPTSWGEEATTVGAVSAALPQDWLWPTYRQNSVGLLRGMDPEPLLRQWRGDRRGFWNPRELRIASITHPVATHLPQAAGLAWAARARGDDACSIAWIGDGGTSEGDFHEGLNHAGVWRAPMVTVCINNQWAISTPLSKQTANPRLADKALGYGIPAERVDGFDVLAVRAAVARALERARRGEGPSFIEAWCYRISPHSTPDDPRLYRDESVTDRWRPLEPVARFRGWLERHGMYEDGLEEEARERCKRLIMASIRRIEADSAPPTSLLVSDVYAEMPWTLREQYAELVEARASFAGEAEDA